jgi:hypothetical protein
VSNRNSELTDAKALLAQLDSGYDSRDVFRTAIGLQDADQSSTPSDEVFIDIYQRCQYRGLSFYSEPEDFLESCLRLSRLLFKYGRAIEAENYLTFLREISGQAEIPAWVWAYSAKLEFLKNLDLCVKHPSLVLNHVQKSLQLQASNRQALAILVEFFEEAGSLIEARTNLRTLEGLHEKITALLDSYVAPNEEAYQNVSELLRERAKRLFPPIYELSSIQFSESIDSYSIAFEQQAPAEPAFDDPLQQRLSELKSRVTSVEDENAELKLLNEELQSQIRSLQEALSAKEHQISELFARVSNAGSGAVGDLTPLGDIGAKVADRPAERTRSATSQVANLPDRTHILVVGASRVPESRLLGICKNLGVEKHQVQFRLDFKAFNETEIASLAYDSKLAGILVGPLPHKVPGCDDPANHLTTGNGYPPAVKIVTHSGELKITKAAFRSALSSLLVKISSDYAETA